MKCPHCKKEIDATEYTRFLGAIKSLRKAMSSAENGKKGGRPKKMKTKKKETNE